MPMYSNYTEIENKIKLIRNKMIDSGIKKGFSHPDTVKLSQELDRLMNKLSMFRR
ncbi:aspartyl-phosphate phosphatase Spo0E family protein [Bacillus dakarensis]|uniref:aspartyl-phosphate phosphatase Spo0E family protein n=1 Tax=Robertmurraya dakarensis TaxID=1926278 RepID=UPI001F1F09D1|nr:aspartyl-phosphate phosphatase Spo0E family protein [Bacillus dakarensis]